jgi:hypothetical protein
MSPTVSPTVSPTANPDEPTGVLAWVEHPHQTRKRYDRAEQE